MSDPRLEAIRARLDHDERCTKPNCLSYYDDKSTARADVAYLLALIDTLQRERDERQQQLDRAESQCSALLEFFDACLCGECSGCGRVDNHVTGEIECPSCCGTGHDSYKAFARAEAAEAQVSRLTEALRKAIGYLRVEPECVMGIAREAFIVDAENLVASPDQEPQPSKPRST